MTTDGCSNIPPAPWHVDPVSRDDDRRMRELIEAWHHRTGERGTKTGTIKRAIRHLWDEEIGSAMTEKGDDDGS